MRAAQGLAWREPSAKSQTASRSCLLAAQRKVTALCLPDWRVDGAAPARQISAWGSGKRARQSPISASRRAARMVPERGSEVKMWPSAWLASWAAICASSALIWVLRLASTAARARVTWALAAPCSPVAPRGAEVSRWQRSAGLVRPLWLAAFSQAASRFSDSQPARSWQSGAGQEGQADRRVQLAEQADCAGVGGLQVGAQLVAGRDPVADQVLAGAAGLAQREGGRAVGDQRPQPGPAGAQHAGGHAGAGAGPPCCPPTHTALAGSSPA